MEKTMVKSAHQKINGDEFKRLIISASYELEKNKEILNDLNVFPVPVAMSKMPQPLALIN